MSRTDYTDEQGKSRSSAARHANLMKRANSLVQQGMYDEAIANIEKAMALRPQDPKCSLQLADIYRAQHRIGPAVEAMKRAMELDPLNSAVHEQLLKTLLDLGRYDEAISASRRLIECSPKNLLARDILGIAYLQQGMLDKALNVTDELIRIDPTDSTHYFKKAVLLQQKGDVAQAMVGFIRVLEMDPEGEMANDAREAIAALDSFQLRQILTIAVEDAVFKTKITLDAGSALQERGFMLSPTGISLLRQIDLDELPSDPQSRYYH